MKTIGIYEIVNNVNGMRYVGSSNWIENRWRDHRRKLRNNKHANKHLQNAYNKYGIENFDFAIVMENKQEQLLIREEERIASYQWDNLYNISIVPGSPMKGKNHTEEIKKLLSEKLSGKNHPQYGKSPTKEHRDKIGKANRKLTDEDVSNIVKHYVEDNMMAREIGNKYGVHLETIFRNLRRRSVSIRTKSESMKIVQQRKREEHS